MKNFKMIVSYDGTRYFGWEHQPDTDMTIQGKLEKVLSQMQELPEGQSVTVIGAGRTDAGVHARAMTCNVLLDTDKTEEEIQAYMNRYLPDDISVNSVRQAAERFHSRFKAIGKTYRYTCWYGSTKPVFDRRYVTVLEREPDLERMQEAHPNAIYQGLGGSFDVYTGNVPRAPKWWIDHDLEYAYRLIKQPSRFKRYSCLFKFAWWLIIKKV